jgi:hypothetical protein
MEFKGPTEVLEYQHNFSLELGTDTVSTSTWTTDSGITKNSDSNTDTTSTIWISGGTLGQTYLVRVEITTVDGRTHNYSFYLRIQDQRAD